MLPWICLPKTIRFHPESRGYHPVLHSRDVRQTPPKAFAGGYQSKDHPTLLAKVQSQKEVQELQEERHLSTVMCPQNESQAAAQTTQGWSTNGTI